MVMVQQHATPYRYTRLHMVGLARIAANKAQQFFKVSSNFWLSGVIQISKWWLRI
jgi:hypothetical protein